MIVADVTDLTVTNVLSRGEPNSECVVIRANNAVNLGQYGIMLGGYTGVQSAIPYFDNLYWFGDGFINANDWMFVYTGAGTVGMTRSVDNLNDIYSLFWGKPTTIFDDPIVVPILFRTDAVYVPEPPDHTP